MPDDARRRRSKAAGSEAEKPRPKAPRRRTKQVDVTDGARRPVVLVVDDQEEVREWLRLSLSLEGWTVEEATNGEDALEQWRKVSPDVVLLDQRLNGRSGLEYASTLRGMSGDARIILLTAHLDEWSTKESRRLRLLPLDKTDHKRLFDVLGLLAEQVRAEKASVS